ncbi:MAG: DUF2723 domain-containing protein [Gemmatimonadaceae bacterium]
MTTVRTISSDRGLFILTTSAVLMLTAGFVDLIRGGITLGPCLLVLAYLVVVPAALWRWGGGWNADTVATDPAPPPYLAATVVGVAVLALYLATLAPSTAMWDTSEYIAAAYTVGIPHPPGNPLFVLVGRVFALVPIASTIAVRLNVLAALCSALAAALWFLTVDRVARDWLPRAPRLIVAALAALVGATAFTVWNQSVVNEKVYTVSLGVMAAISWLMFRWCDASAGKRGDALLLLVAYLLGLGYSNHMVGMLPAPAVFLVILMRRPRTLLRWRLVLGAMGLVVVGLTPFATQPVRAAYNPPINEGEPTACREGLKVSCTFSQKTWDAFSYNFNRKQYGKPDLSIRQAPFTAQVGMWWLYFRWQWLRDVNGERPLAQSLMAIAFLLLAGLGGWTHYHKHRASFWYFGPLIGLLTLALIYYLNFRYGASQDPGLTVLREVRDRDYFFIWSFSALSVWIALGLAALWNHASGLLDEVRGFGARRAWIVTAPMLLVAAVPLAANWSTASRRGDQATLAFAHDLLNSVEPYSVLITGGDNDTFPLWYAQEVEGIRKDVTIGVLSLMNTEWYPRAMIRRPIYEYDAARGPAIYRNKVWVKPTTPPIRLSLAQVDSIPEYIVIREPVVFERPGLRAVIDPKQLTPDGSGGGILERADMLVLRALADTWPQRPVYISRTTGGYAQRMGLGDNVVTRGLAQAVVPAPISASEGRVRIDGDGWFDLPTSQALWTDVYAGPAAITALGQWVDRPSASVPFVYVVSGSTLAQVLQANGDSRAAARVNGTVERLARIIGVEQLLRDTYDSSPRDQRVPGG